jgi:hypothetical protein
MESIESLRKKAVSPQRLKADGSYTSPRSYGVYRLTGRGDVGRRYRFGNHPVRMDELNRDYGACELEGLFLERADAELLTTLLNSK